MRSQLFTHSISWSISWLKTTLPGFLAIALLGSCSQEVSPNLLIEFVPNDQVLNSNSYGLSAITGTYSNCLAHTDQATWSLAIPNSLVAGLPPTLVVVAGNESCGLNIDHLYFEKTLNNSTQILSYQVVTSLPITNFYQPFGIGFAPTINQPAEVYANAFRTNYDQNFTITVRYSDQINAVSQMIPSSYGTDSAQLSSSSVTAPDYTFSQGDLTIGVDLNNNVFSVSGAANLTPNLQSGQNYVIVTDILQASNGFIGGNMFDYGDVSYTFSNSFPHTSIFGGIVSINGGAPLGGNGGFNLAGHLPQTKYIIIENRDTGLGISAYQVFSVTFNGQ